MFSVLNSLVPEEKFPLLWTKPSFAAHWTLQLPWSSTGGLASPSPRAPPPSAERLSALTMTVLSTLSLPFEGNQINNICLNLPPKYQ